MVGGNGGRPYKHLHVLFGPRSAVLGLESVRMSGYST